MTTYSVSGEVELFPQEGGWFYVAVPRWITDELDGLADRGLVAIRATVFDVSWDTSLMPMGDGSHFIALNARVRRSRGLDVGDPVQVSFTTRRR